MERSSSSEKENFGQYNPIRDEETVRKENDKSINSSAIIIDLNKIDSPAANQYPHCTANRVYSMKYILENEVHEIPDDLLNDDRPTTVQADDERKLKTNLKNKKIVLIKPINEPYARLGRLNNNKTIMSLKGALTITKQYYPENQWAWVVVVCTVYIHLLNFVISLNGLNLLIGHLLFEQRYTILNSLTTSHLKCFDIDSFFVSNRMNFMHHYMNHLNMNRTDMNLTHLNISLQHMNNLTMSQMSDRNQMNHLNYLTTYQSKYTVSNETNGINAHQTNTKRHRKHSSQLDELKNRQKFLFDYGLLLTRSLVADDHQMSNQILMNEPFPDQLNLNRNKQTNLDYFIQLDASLMDEFDEFDKKFTSDSSDRRAIDESSDSQSTNESSDAKFINESNAKLMSASQTMNDLFTTNHLLTNNQLNSSSNTNKQFNTYASHRSTDKPEVNNLRINNSEMNDLAHSKRIKQNLLKQILHKQPFGRDEQLEQKLMEQNYLEQKVLENLKTQSTNNCGAILLKNLFRLIESNAILSNNQIKFQMGKFLLFF